MQFFQYSSVPMQTSWQRCRSNPYRLQIRKFTTDSEFSGFPSVDISKFKPTNPNYEKKVRESFDRQGLCQHLGAKITAVKPGFVEIQMPFNKNLSQQHGFFHAGGIATIADTAGGYAALTLMPATSSVLSVEFKLNLLSPADGQLLISQASVIKPGKTLSVTFSSVYAVKDGQKKLCSTCVLTVMNMADRSDEAGMNATKQP